MTFRTKLIAFISLGFVGFVSFICLVSRSVGGSRSDSLSVSEMNALSHDVELRFGTPNRVGSTSFVSNGGNSTVLNVTFDNPSFLDFPEAERVAMAEAILDFVLPRVPRAKLPSRVCVVFSAVTRTAGVRVSRDTPYCRSRLPDSGERDASVDSALDR